MSNEKQEARRHEVTVDGVSYWAGKWCVFGAKRGHHQCTVYASEGGPRYAVSIPKDHSIHLLELEPSPSVAARVLAYVLLEAANIAEGAASLAGVDWSHLNKAQSPAREDAS